MLSNMYSIRILTTEKGYRKLCNYINDYLQYNYLVNNSSELLDENKLNEKNLYICYRKNGLIYCGVEEIKNNSNMDKALNNVIDKLRNTNEPFKIVKFDLDNFQYSIMESKNTPTMLSDITIGFDDEYTKKNMYAIKHKNIRENEEEILKKLFNELECD